MNDPNEMSQAEYEEKYGHSRYVPISLRTDETHDGHPFIITVAYHGPSNGHRGVELDSEIMPLIRKALEEYKANRKAEWKDHRVSR